MRLRDFGINRAQMLITLGLSLLTIVYAQDDETTTNPNKTLTRTKRQQPGSISSSFLLIISFILQLH